MAAKRMFSIDVIDTDKFLDMPVSTQALYFHFGMRADDDGFVSSPKKIVKIANCTNDDLRILISKDLICDTVQSMNDEDTLSFIWTLIKYLTADRGVQG